MAETLIERFIGDERHSDLVQTLMQNPGVGYDTRIANFIAEKGHIRSYKLGEKLMKQGGDDRHVCFLLLGNVAIDVNGKNKRVRNAPFQVGEMAALDPSSTRSATVVAKSEEVVVIELQQSDFKSLVEGQSGFLERIEADKTNRFKEYLDEVVAPTKIVVLVHGIRTRAPWYKEVKASLEKHGYTVILTSYGRVDLVRFLEWSTFFRKLITRRMIKTFRRIAHENPNSEISIIAHSFGTYIVLNTMLELFEFSAKRIIFAGSVAPELFPIGVISTQFEDEILNEVVSGDIWPVVADSLSFGYGAPGTFGFKNPGFVDRWNSGGHSSLLTAIHCEQCWVPFLENGKITESVGEIQSSQWMDLISTFKLKYIVLIAAAVFVAIKLF